MNQHINAALDFAEKSMAPDHKHGAVCAIGGKIVCGGFNYPTEPHCFKGERECCPLSGKPPR